VPKESVRRVRDAWSRAECAGATYRSIEAVAAVLRAAEQSHTYLELARLAVKVLLRAEAALVTAVPDGWSHRVPKGAGTEPGLQANSLALAL